MSTFKQLETADVFTNSYKVHKEWVVNNTPFPEINGIKYYKGVKQTNRFLLKSDLKSNNHYNTLNYELINTLFYRSFDGMEFDTGSLKSSNYYDNVITGSLSRDNNRYADSYPNIINQFPTGEGEEIYVIQISKDIFGERLMPSYFKLQSNIYDIRDDSFGNICDHYNNQAHVGNIFYNHGVIVITNQNYISYFPEFLVAIDDYITI